MLSLKSLGTKTSKCLNISTEMIDNVLVESWYRSNF